MKRSDHPILSDPAVLAAALWCLASHALIRRRLRRVGLRARVLPPPPLPARGRKGVAAVLAVRQATCLERSLVLQRWLGSHGADADVLIGVAPRHSGAPTPAAPPLVGATRRRSGTPAPAALDLHAWIDGVDDDGGVHEVLHRIGAPT